MIRIAIVGVGQIGSRHLQAMAKLRELVVVHLVEPCDASFEIAKERFLQVYRPESVAIELKRSRSIAELGEKIDVAVVATSSDVRAAVVKDLVRSNLVRNLILEKILFQKVDDYFEIGQLLREHNTPTWVNCWMRDAAFFRELKARLDLNQTIHMQVEGSLWGIGCKGIHFLDLFAYLIENPDIAWSACHLDRKLVDTKRPGFKEFTGALTGTNAKGHGLDLVSHDTGSDPLVIRIQNDSQRHEVTFSGQYLLHRAVRGNTESFEKIALPLQSEMTHRVVHEIIESGSCNLPTYDDSQRLHLCLIKALLQHLETVSGEKVELCPIT